MTQPYLAQGPVATNQLNSGVPTADGILNKRDIWAKVFTNFSSSAVVMNGFSADLQRMAKEIQTDTSVIYHAERQDIFQTATISTMTYVSGKNFLITFTTGSVDSINSLYYSPGVIDDIILSNNGKTRARVVAKAEPTGNNTGHTITVSASDTTDVSSGGLQTAFIALFTGGNAKISFIDSAASEFGQFREGQFQTYDIFQCTWQKLRDQIPTISMEASGQAMEVSLSDGRSAYLPLTLGDMMERFMVKKSLSLLTGNGGLYTDQVTGLPTRENQGLHSLGLTYGGSTTITNATPIDEALLRTLIRYFNANQMGDEIVGYLGQEIYFKFQSLLGSLSNSAGIRFNSFPNKQVDFGFQSFFWGGKTWHLKAAPEFQHPNLLDLGSLAANYWPNTAIFFQMGDYAGPTGEKLGTFGANGQKSVINTYVFGQVTKGAAPTAKVKTSMTYQDYDINNTEANKVIMSQRFTLQYQGAKKIYVIEGA